MLDCLWFENFKTWLAFKDVGDINDFVSNYAHNKVTFQKINGALCCPSIKFTNLFFYHGVLQDVKVISNVS